MIRIEARIIAVADSFDAMSSDRLYRAGINVNEAVAEIQKLSGVKYDENIVKHFERIYQQDPSFAGRYKR